MSAHMTIKDLTRAFGSDLRALCRLANSCTPPKEPINRTDKGFPVRGECVIPVYPIYVLFANSEDREFVINPLERVASAASSMLPGDARRDGGAFYTPAPDLSCWQTISAENMPMSAHMEAVFGEFEVWIDPKMPNGHTPVQFDAGPLVRDFVLRADSKHRLTDETGSYSYIDIGQDRGNGEVNTPILFMSRLECAIEFDVNTLKWNLLDACPEVSAIYNATQHKNFAVTAKPGRASYTGEQIAKMVLAAEEGMNILAQRYEEGLEKILLTTRFKVMHPIDTVGYFLRYSATAAVNAGINVHPATRDSFPVYLHDTLLDRWYSISTGFCRTPKSALPPACEMAGTLSGLYEVYYDKSAEDVYTYNQIAWLLKVVMCSQYMPTSKGLTAMYGCMAHLNSFIAGALGVETVTELETVPGTRIKDLTALDAQVDVCSIAMGLNTPHVRTHIYESESNQVQLSSGHISAVETSIQAETGSYVVSPMGMCNILHTISESGMFNSWEAQLKGAEDLELIEPGPAYKAFFEKAPHIYDPFTEAAPVSVYLSADGKMYCLNHKGHWCDAMFEESEAGAHGIIPADTYFSGKLYYRPNGQNISLSTGYVTNLLYTTAKYFIPFDTIPTVFMFLYNADKESGTWTQTGMNDVHDEIIIGLRDIIAYKPSTKLWRYVRDVNYTSGAKIGPVYATVPEQTLTSEDLVDAVGNLQKFLRTVDYPDATSHPMFYDAPRHVTEVCDSPVWTINVYGTNYTAVDGDWARCQTKAEGSEEISSGDFVTLILGFILNLANFTGANGACAMFAHMLGEAFTANIEDTPSPDTSHIYYVDDQHVWVSTHGLDDGEGLEEWTTEAGVPALGVHCVHFSFTGDVDMVPLKDACQVLINAQHVDDILPLYDSARKSVTESQMLSEAEIYNGRVNGLILSTRTTVIKRVPVDGRTPLFIFETKDGTLWGHTGVEWTGVIAKSPELVCAGSVFGINVYYHPDLDTAPVSVEALTKIIYSFLGSFWMGWKDPWYCYVLNKLRLGNSAAFYRRNPTPHPQPKRVTATVPQPVQPPKQVTQPAQPQQRQHVQAAPPPKSTPVSRSAPQPAPAPQPTPPPQPQSAPAPQPMPAPVPQEPTPKQEKHTPSSRGSDKLRELRNRRKGR